MNMEKNNIDLTQIKDLGTAISIIEQLLEENRLLKERILKLEEQIAKLSKNSKNSSKPPSSDIVKKPQEQRKPGERKIGAQKGHKGHKRNEIPPEQIDFTKKMELSHCPDCGQSMKFSETHKEVLIQQVIEIVEKPVIVTEYQRYGKFCKHCQRYHYPALPKGVVENQLFGTRLQALTGYIKGNLFSSYTKIQEFFQELFHISVSRGLIENTVHRNSKAIFHPYQQLGCHIRKEDNLNVDESGWYNNGSLFWAWIFCTKEFDYFTIDKSRGAKVLKRVLTENFSGSITSDFLPTYIKFANPNQQFCLAHLIRDIKYLATLPYETAKKFSQELLSCFRTIFDIWHEREKLSAQEFSNKSKAQVEIISTILKTFTDLPKAANKIAKRMKKHWDSIWRFLSNLAALEPTNNLAERAIRPISILRKITQGSRSLWGRSWNERIMTVIGTCKKQGRSVWNFLYQSINAFYFNDPFPSLIPDGG